MSTTINDLALSRKAFALMVIMFKNLKRLTTHWLLFSGLWLPLSCGATKKWRDAAHMNHFLVAATGASVMDIGEVVYVAAVLKKTQRKMQRRVLDAPNNQSLGRFFP